MTGEDRERFETSFVNPRLHSVSIVEFGINMENFHSACIDWNFPTAIGDEMESDVGNSMHWICCSSHS